MSTQISTLAVHLVRSWARFYTSGLPSDIRVARHAEIESDLWEHGRDADAAGRPPDETAFQMLGRFLLGIPADLFWRLEQAEQKRRAREDGNGILRKGNMGALGLIQRAFPIGVIALAGMLIALVVDTAFGVGDYATDLERIVDGLLIGFAALMLLTGLWVCRRIPWLGGVLLVAGAAAMGYVMYWTIFFPALAALVAALGVLRAWRFAHEPRSTA